MSAATPTSSRFQRFLLPGFALKAVIIGGGYATGRELAEFFLPAGPWGGLLGMLVAMVIWSLVSALTFALARAWQAFDYVSFFRRLLGPLWPLFEAAWLIFVVLILAVFGAAAGAIGRALLGLPEAAGTIALGAAILILTVPGRDSVERFFRHASTFIYATYALFFVAVFLRLREEIADGLAAEPGIAGGWLEGGFTYSAYNLVGAVVILPVLRHLTSARDAVIAGTLAGPLAMLPAILFFLAMLAFLPDIATATLPSDMILRTLAVPGLMLLFQTMVFVALVESGVGALHALYARSTAAALARNRAPPGAWARILSGAALLAFCMFVADAVGLVDLVARGYRFLAALFLAVYLVPLLTVGLWRLARPANCVETC
ncbi:MAG: hypothetical protein SNJ63_01600 [Sphingomonadaceae bacterium]